MMGDDATSILTGIGVREGEIFAMTITVQRQIQRGKSGPHSNAVLKFHLTTSTTIDGRWDGRQEIVCLAALDDCTSIKRLAVIEGDCLQE